MRMKQYFCYKKRVDYLPSKGLMIKNIYVLTLSLLLTSCHSQENSTHKNSKLGGPCEGCEAIYEYGDKELSFSDTLPGYEAHVPKLKLTGIVYHKDGKIPAENVIIYIYHTDRKGIYASNGEEQGWGRRHGINRGWVKTDKLGRYAFYTFRPAAYPNRAEPEHIHITIKEPNKKEYYIDAFQFSDDPLLNKSKKSSLNNRGGSGIVTPITNNGILEVKRNIILGLNIPHYN